MRFLRLPSVLLDDADETLVDYERRLRKIVARRFPQWPIPSDLPDCTVPGARALMLIYHSMVISFRNRRKDAIADVRTALQNGDNPTGLEARARQLLAMHLYALSIEEQVEGNVSLAEENARECKAVCEEALSVYSREKWFSNISYGFHIPLGIVFYYRDQLGNARQHLEAGIEEWMTVMTAYDQHQTEIIGMAHMFLGDVCRQEGDSSAALIRYRRAGALVTGIYRSEVLARIISQMIGKPGTARSVRRMSRRALRQAQRLGAREDLIEELKCDLGWALWEMKKYREAERIYADVAATTVNEETKRHLERFLETVRKGAM